MAGSDTFLPALLLTIFFDKIFQSAINKVCEIKKAEPYLALPSLFNN
jgi:hypothetical protein